jgi:peptidoglycan/LPS O-acetylase OafA/YrhL
MFGFAMPGSTSIVTGGRSIGIEFVFYILFPLISVFISSRKIIIYNSLVLALILQITFIHMIYIDCNSISENWVNYTHPLSFIFYFVSGCFIGKLVKHYKHILLPKKIVFILFVFTFLLILINNNPFHQTI